MSRKRAIATFLSRKFMIMRLSITFEDFPDSLIASQGHPARRPPHPPDSQRIQYSCTVFTSSWWTCSRLFKTQDDMDRGGQIIVTQFEPMWARQVNKVCTLGVPQHGSFSCPRLSPALTSPAEKPLLNWSWEDQKSTTPGQTHQSRKRENRLMENQVMCGILIRPPQKCRPMS